MNFFVALSTADVLPFQQISCWDEVSIVLSWSKSSEFRLERVTSRTPQQVETLRQTIICNVHPIGMLMIWRDFWLKYKYNFTFGEPKISFTQTDIDAEI
ncbi:hypothetical protein TNCT_594591 [Trichonephila clavata]|uniref:Uncharacterized protein n=1 Tax=Trichonephila clavata TaxID=2740835 RepID=A0A8X6GZB3_TRICU|nr:hypothetical protein TNCT_594591 [Trichonephila clavata]